LNAFIIEGACVLLLGQDKTTFTL